MLIKAMLVSLSYRCVSVVQLRTVYDFCSHSRPLCLIAVRLVVKFSHTLSLKGQIFDDIVWSYG